MPAAPADAVYDGDAALRTTAVELGSVTKAITGIAVARLAAEGVLSLDAAVHDVLGLGRPWTVDGSVVTVEDLATHHAGLPRLGELGRVDPDDPYRGCEDDAVLAQLERAVFTPGPRRYEYSNLGFAVLGLCIGRVAGSWAEVVRARVLEPLEVSGVWAGPPPAGVPRATGRARWGRAVPWWTMAGYAAAGACTATGDGVAALLASLLRAGDRSPAVDAAWRAATTPRRPIDGGHVGLAWHVAASGHAWHNGATGGFSTIVAFDPTRTRAVARLAVGPSRPDDERGAVASLR